MFLHDSLEDTGSPSHTIRLVNILRSEDESSPVQCVLTTYDIFPCDVKVTEPQFSMEEGASPFGPSAHMWTVEMPPSPRTLNDDVPQYEGLSYVWGPPYPRSNITVNGQTFSVSERLETAMKDLRDRDTDRVMWIDAICINQQDAQEKNIQVRLMTKIYQNAVGVVAWLGPSCEMGQSAIETIEDIGGSQDMLVDDFYDGINPLEKVPQVMPGASKLQDVIADGSEKWRALEWLLTNPWWTRVWIIQEGSYAKQLRFQIGRSKFVLGSLKNIVSCRDARMANFMEFPQYRLLGPVALLIQQRQLLKDTWRIQGFVNSTPLPGILKRFDAYKATDPRDKIYALLNLADIDRLGLQIDYRKSVKEVYQDTIRATTKQYTRNLDFLHLLNRSMRSSQAPLSLPSWVPDFSLQQEICALGPHELGYELYTAAGISDGTRHLDIDQCFEDILEVSGCRIDVLDWVPAYIPWDSFGDGSWEKMVRTWYHFVVEGTQPPSTLPHISQDVNFATVNQPAKPGVPSLDCPERKQYVSGGTREDAVIKTLFMDQGDTRQRLRDSEFVQLRAWFRALLGHEHTLCSSEQCVELATSTEDVNTAMQLLHDHDAVSPCDGDARTVLAPDNGLDEEQLAIIGSISKESEKYFRELEISIRERRLMFEREAAERELRRKLRPIPFSKMLAERLPGWKLATTKKGYIALVPFNAEAGDVIVVLRGFEVPVLLRESASIICGLDTMHQTKIVGTAYVHGIMDGCEEVLRRLENESEPFVLG
jgi:hypothetical protein